MSDDAKTPAPQEERDTSKATPFQSLQDEIERLLHAFSLPELHWPANIPAPSETLGLRMDVGETEDGIQITAELPGVSEDDIELSLENNLLRISAVKSIEDQKGDKTWHVTERSFGKLERSIRVPNGLDPDAIKAVHKNGILTISIPKPADMASSTRKIAVTSA